MQPLASCDQGQQVFLPAPEGTMNFTAQTRALQLTAFKAPKEEQTLSPD